MKMMGVYYYCPATCGLKPADNDIQHRAARDGKQRFGSNFCKRKKPYPEARGKYHSLHKYLIVPP